MAPVFVFGTGRCGSTHLQRLITLSTACWIWGEHAGFLAPLLEAVARYSANEALERFVFSVRPRDDREMIQEMLLAPGHLAWVNRLDRGDVGSAVCALIDQLFRSRLPQGWTEWGFKEITYGIDDNTPLRLMGLFPAATAVFSFREPESTLASMIHAWTPDLVTDPSSEQRLSETYANRVQRWRAMMEYFLAHKNEFGGRLTFVSADKLNRPVLRLMEVIGLPVTRRLRSEISPTNRGMRSGPAWADAKLAELFAPQAAACNDLFARACARSEADFAR